MPIDTGARGRGRRIGPTHVNVRVPNRSPGAAGYQAAIRPSNVSAPPRAERRYTQAYNYLSAPHAGTTALPGLSPQQSLVANTVLGQGLRAGAGAQALLAAAETGLVESNFLNLPGGSADWSGWRQERSSIYGTGPQGPQNVRASAARFFRELATQGAGAPTPGQAAQAAQGSAFPARYDQAQARALPIVNAFLTGGARGRQAEKVVRGMGVQPPPVTPGGGAVGGGMRGAPVAQRFVNPLPGWGQSRTDMGIDFSAPAGTPIRAMGKGRYLGVGQGPGWPGTPGGETGILYQLKKSKGLPSPYVFAYEGVRTNPKLQPGQKIHKGDVLGTGSGGGIETGFATSSGETLSVAHGTQSHSGDPGAVPTPEGRAYQNLLAKLPGSTVTKGAALPVSAGGYSTGAAAGYSAGFGGAVPIDGQQPGAQPSVYSPAYPIAGRSGLAASPATPLAQSSLQAALSAILGGGSAAAQGGDTSPLAQILQRQRFRPRR